MIPALIQCGDLRLSTKALGSKKASHVIVAKTRQNPHDPPHAILVGCRSLRFWRGFAPTPHAFLWGAASFPKG